MRVALLSDIHANLPALEAVIKGIRRHSPEAIVSLGDQVNLGPCPRETLALLKAENVACLHGNHERYILSAMAGDPGYNGANFQALRFNAALLTADQITFPKEMTIGCATLTHAMPGDDRFPVYDPAQALPLLEKLSLPAGTHILCGHGHNPTSYAFGGVTIHSIGSVGCMDDAPAGVAPYVIADIDEHHVAMRPYYAAYDPARLKPLFLASGMADFCPVMARIACLEMTNNREYLVDFVRRAHDIAAARGETEISSDVWSQADSRYPWPGGMTTAAFWRG